MRGFRLFILAVVILISPVIVSALQNIPQEKNIRAIHFVLRMITMEDALLLVDKAKKAGFNTALVQLTDGVKLDHAPWKPLPNAWSKKDLRKWVLYAEQNGIKLIPELKLLTHQAKFFQSHYPRLMYNLKTYDPRNKEVYQKIFPLIDEVIGLFRPRAIHIGHDEVKGWHKSWKTKIKEYFIPDDMLPANLFLEDIKIIHSYLKNKGVETWMWGDMLLSPTEFPKDNRKWTPYHGSAPGYGKELREKIPKEIVICDWQYFSPNSDFPSLALFIKEGFRVLGATFKRKESTRNFSKYAAEHEAEGMIATTWFHVQRQEWITVDQIIETSGDSFNKDFPDAK